MLTFEIVSGNELDENCINYENRIIKHVKLIYIDNK
jgi:hypothetical protein